ncbi:hypothetical protein Btru_014256 [Bulinus truncatus]|nr:hypothetical protein Btru_014256 [Bulinus truncatus]
MRIDPSESQECRGAPGSQQVPVLHEELRRRAPAAPGPGSDRVPEPEVSGEPVTSSQFSYSVLISASNPSDAIDIDVDTGDGVGGWGLLLPGLLHYLFVALHLRSGLYGASARNSGVALRDLENGCCTLHCPTLSRLWFSSKQSKQKEPTRSKSEFDLTQISLSRLEDESDENNNNTSSDSIDLPHNDAVDGGSSHGETVTKSSEDSALISSEEDTKLKGKTTQSPGYNFVSKSSDSAIHPEPITLTSPSQTRGLFQANAEDCTPKGSVFTSTKPVPLPRKLREKPVPPPRKYKVSSFFKDIPTDGIGKQVPSFVLTDAQPPTDSPKSLTRTVTKSDTKPAIPKKPVVTSSLSKSGIVPGASRQDANGITQLSLKSPCTGTDRQCTYTATPIFISSPDTDSPNFKARPVFISKLGVSLVQDNHSHTKNSQTEHLDSASRKPCTDPLVSGKLVHIERNSPTSDSSGSKNKTIKGHISENWTDSAPASKLEMSIESADQAVYESGVSIVPSATMEADLEQSEEGEVREVTRANSSLSGILDQQDSSPLSLSPTPYSSSVPRSHSDISCRLESQHSRDSSIVSSHSRLSRASAGADLENFFNQMGLEKGVLEPFGRLRELQTGEVFDSMSSLDSHDAASICSAYSRSDQEWSESHSSDRSHQQTSIIERNARIIKWLCNVRKAKNQAAKAESAVGGKD